MPQMFHRVVAMDGGRRRTKSGKQAEQKICRVTSEKHSERRQQRGYYIVRDNTLVLRTARPAFKQITRLYQTGR
jgi:hypothetical protein